MSEYERIRLSGGPPEYDGREMDVRIPGIALVAPGLDDSDVLDPEAHTWVASHVAADGITVYKYREN